MTETLYSHEFCWLGYAVMFQEAIKVGLPAETFKNVVYEIPSGKVTRNLYKEAHDPSIDNTIH